MDAMRLLGQLLQNNPTGGNMLGQLLKGATGGGGGGGGLGALGGLLGGAGGGQQSGAGLLGALAKAAMGGGQGGGGAAGLLGSLLGGGSEPAAQPAAQAVQPQQGQDQAELLIRAMCNAAKADGQVDEQEQQNIIGKLGEVEQSEIDFLRKELSSPLDVQGFVNSVPRELAADVYALSLMTVKVDTRAEAGYLQQLAQGLQIDQQTLGQIHQQLGVS
jgi:uncharacterized membrane protein YebE (DUF533 family)